MITTRRRFLGLSAVAMGLGAIWLQSAQAAGEVPASPISEQLSITGNVESVLKFSWIELRDQPTTVLPDVPVRTRDGALVKTHKGYRGILLTRLLEQARIRQTDPGALKRTVIIARATDGYVALFSWNELYNTAVGEQVFVLTGRAGEPLDDGEGRIALISLQDQRTGPRHVRWLKEIRVDLISAQD